jgi:LPXTG-motif cell wall-anchored protein
MSLPEFYRAVYYKKDGTQQQSLISQTDNGGKIVNEFCAYELPNTGGPGTRLFTILGSILMMFAGAMLVRKRRYI